MPPTGLAEPTKACTSKLTYVGNSKAGDQSWSVSGGQLAIDASGTKICIGELEQTPRTQDFESRLRIDSLTGGEYAQVNLGFAGAQGGAGASLARMGSGKPLQIDVKATGYGVCDPATLTSPTFPVTLRVRRIGTDIAASATDGAGKSVTSTCTTGDAHYAAKVFLLGSNADEAPALSVRADDWVTTGPEGCFDDFASKRF